MTQPAGTPRLPLVDPDSSPPEVAEAFKQFPPINVFRVMANARTLFSPYVAYVARLFKPLALDAATERMIVLRVARRSDCLYAWRENVVVARSVGVSDEQIAAIDKGDTNAGVFSDAQKAALAFSDEVMDLIEVTEPTYQAAKQHFSDQALTEILYVVGNYMFVARLTRTGHVPLDDNLAQSPQ
jgi:alkylhydroperoxidase family enzyme